MGKRNANRKNKKPEGKLQDLRWYRSGMPCGFLLASPTKTCPFGPTCPHRHDPEGLKLIHWDGVPFSLYDQAQKAKKQQAISKAPLGQKVLSANGSATSNAKAATSKTSKVESKKPQEKKPQEKKFKKKFEKKQRKDENIRAQKDTST